MNKVQARALKLGDVVRIGSDIGNPFSDALVSNVTEGEVTFFRPYATMFGFQYTGGTVPLIGIEVFKVSRDSGQSFTVFHNAMTGGA